VTTAAVEDLLRALTPQVLGALVRRHGQFENCEDAVQEAAAAAAGWPAEGVPDNPRGWLLTVASRRLIDQVRSDHARRQRESATAAEPPPDDVPGADDTLALLFLCCHPALTAASQTALTLRAVGGLTTAEIARAFLVPEATMGARISRAKQRIRAAGSTFSLPAAADREERLRVVLHVLYLIFNEGYTASSGRALDRVDLAREAIRLARMVHAQLPDDGEVTGLLALMLLTHARREARTTAAGDLVPLAEQDRARWDRDLIDEGTELAKASLAASALGPYQLQAAIAATHADAATAEETNWRQVHAAYLILERIAPNPMVTLNRAVALAETEGPQAGLALLATLDGDERMAGHHRLLSVRAHLLERAGDPAAAYQHYRRAARSTASLAEQRYLESRASRVRPRSDGLLARLRRGAVDLRVHAQVVKRTGDERHRDRADLGATTDGPVVVTALACGNRADDQPDDNQQRPDAHRDPLT
jgi:RNA polymerase sigma factor (sigma-70 family)